MKWQTRKLTSNQVGLKYGFRSGLEIAISEELDLNKIKYEFEKVKLKYTVPEKVHTYTPDFYLKEKFSIVDTFHLKSVKIVTDHEPLSDNKRVIVNAFQCMQVN